MILQVAGDTAKSNRMGHKTRTSRLLAVIRVWGQEAASSLGCAVAAHRIAKRLLTLYLVHV
jgi:hypothetical protein